MTGTTIPGLIATEFKQFVQESVAQSGATVLGDPDEGLRVRDDFGEELQRSLAEIKTEGRTTSLADVAERLQSAR